MVTILDEAPSFGSLAGKALSQGLQTGTSHGIDFANKMKLELSRGKGLAQEAKNIEKAKPSVPYSRHFLPQADLIE